MKSETHESRADDGGMRRFFHQLHGCLLPLFFENNPSTAHEKKSNHLCPVSGQNRAATKSDAKYPRNISLRHRV